MFTVATVFDVETTLISAIIYFIMHAIIYFLLTHDLAYYNAAILNVITEFRKWLVAYITSQQTEIFERNWNDCYMFAIWKILYGTNEIWEFLCLQLCPLLKTADTFYYFL